MRLERLAGGDDIVWFLVAGFELSVQYVKFLIETEVTQGSCTQMEWETKCAAGARGCGGRVNVGRRFIFVGGRNGLVWSISGR